MSQTRAHVLITGRVQGVAFRYNTARMAQGLGLAGWVRNLFDGRVEAQFQGPEHYVNKAVQWCYQGPRSARVDAVDIQWLELSDDLDQFDITY